MTSRRWILVAVVLGFGLAGIVPMGGAEPARIDAPAPEITAGPWINSAPLTLAELRGRVVLVEFWTYG